MSESQTSRTNQFQALLARLFEISCRCLLDKKPENFSELLKSCSQVARPLREASNTDIEEIQMSEFEMLSGIVVNFLRLGVELEEVPTPVGEILESLKNLASRVERWCLGLVAQASGTQNMLPLLTFDAQSQDSLRSYLGCIDVLIVSGEEKERNLGQVLLEGLLETCPNTFTEGNLGDSVQNIMPGIFYQWINHNRAPAPEPDLDMGQPQVEELGADSCLGLFFYAFAQGCQSDCVVRLVQRANYAGICVPLTCIEGAIGALCKKGMEEARNVTISHLCYHLRPIPENGASESCSPRIVLGKMLDGGVPEEDVYSMAIQTLCREECPSIRALRIIEFVYVLVVQPGVENPQYSEPLLHRLFADVKAAFRRFAKANLYDFVNSCAEYPGEVRRILPSAFYEFPGEEAYELAFQLYSQSLYSLNEEVQPEFLGYACDAFLRIEDERVRRRILQASILGDDGEIGDSTNAFLLELVSRGPDSRRDLISCFEANQPFLVEAKEIVPSASIGIVGLWLKFAPSVFFALIEAVEKDEIGANLQDGICQYCTFIWTDFSEDTRYVIPRDFNFLVSCLVFFDRIGNLESLDGLARWMVEKCFDPTIGEELCKALFSKVERAWIIAPYFVESGLNDTKSRYRLKPILESLLFSEVDPGEGLGWRERAGWIQGLVNRLTQGRVIQYESDLTSNSLVQYNLIYLMLARIAVHLQGSIDIPGVSWKLCPTFGIALEMIKLHPAYFDQQNGRRIYFCAKDMSWPGTSVPLIRDEEAVRIVCDLYSLQEARHHLSPSAYLILLSQLSDSELLSL